MLVFASTVIWPQVFEAVINKGGERVLSQELTASEKKRRVVLKRVNLDGSGVRTNFLQGGTMARVRLLQASIVQVATILCPPPSWCLSPAKRWCSGAHASLLVSDNISDSTRLCGPE